MRLILDIPDTISARSIQEAMRLLGNLRLTCAANGTVVGRPAGPSPERHGNAHVIHMPRHSRQRISPPPEPEVA